MIRGRHKHSLAYCFVTYVSEDGQRESLWNSRDGAVPIEIPSMSGDLMVVEAEPARLQPDYRPQHTPEVGDRIFVDLTEQRARILASERIDRWEQHERGPLGGLGLPTLQDMFGSREAAVESAFEEFFEPDSPDILVVTRGYLNELEHSRMRDSTIFGGLELLCETEAAAAQPATLFEREVKRISSELKRTSTLDFYDRDLIPIDFETWRELHADKSYTQIESTMIGEICVSTIWTGVDSSVGRGRFVFETRVLNAAEWLPSEESSIATSSIADAKLAHATFVETLSRIESARPKKPGKKHRKS